MTSDDIVTRLRSLTIGYAMEGSWRTILAEAADEIERLREGARSSERRLAKKDDELDAAQAEIERLRAQWEHFQKLASEQGGE
jgi:chromosome segregation ATPase